MLKRICSVLLMIAMVMSMCTFAYADYVYVDSFSENNMSAKKIAIAKGYAFVASGKDVESTDVLNVYNLDTKQLAATLSVPVYETGRDYFVENMYVTGEYMYISWNRNKGWGDPFVRKYAIDDMINGELKSLKSFGIRGDHVTCFYEDKLFYTEPGYRTLDMISCSDDTAKDVMSLTEFDRNYLEKTLRGLGAQKDYFYMYTADEIKAYTTKNLYSGLMQNFHETEAVYKSEVAIENITFADDVLFVTTEQGLEVLKVSEKNFVSLGKYTDGGKIMAVTPVGELLYVYSEKDSAILVLDATDYGNITLKETIKLNNENTSGINDIKVDGDRIYVADLTAGFGLYSANELDALEKETTKEAETYAEELQLSSQKKAIELVVGLKIMDLRSDGLFGKNSYITRGEFANACAKLLGESANGNYKSIEFTDVLDDSPYASGIYALANLGIINGYGDGTFKPENPVLYEHAIKIMIKVLGYYPLVENSNRTCESLASELGILNSISPMSNGYISRENVARLFYNSLEVATLKFSSGLDPYKYESSKDETLLYKMGIKKVKGQITATEFTSLSGGYKATKGKVEIGDVQYLEGTSGAKNYLGRNVTAYYTFDETKNGEIVFVLPNEKDEVLTISAEDISPETTKGVFAYYDENEKLQKKNIQDAAVIINGIFDSAFNATDLVPDDGEVELLDADDDGNIDTVIVKSFKTYLVSAYSQGIFRLQYGYSDINVNKLLKDGSQVSVWIDGYKANIEKIDGVKLNTVLSVMMSRKGEICDIYVTNSQAVGMITSAENKRSLTIEGVKYEISKSHLVNAQVPANNIPSVTAGDEIYAYLDVFGKIAGINPLTSEEIYGYLLACDRSEGLDTSKVNFKLLADDENEIQGSIQKFESAENLKVNGVKVEDIYTVSELFGTGGLKKQLIKFSLNHEGKIKEVFTAIDKVSKELEDGTPNPHYENKYKGYTLNQFTYDVYISSSLAYRGGDRGTFEGQPFVPTLYTKIFVVPVYEDPKDEEYKMYDNTTIFKSGSYPPGSLYVYDVEEDYDMGACVIKVGADTSFDSIDESKKFIIIDSFMKGIDENGEETTILVGAKNQSGEQQTINVYSDEIEDNGTWNSLYKGKKLVDLPKGSIIQYITNGRGAITAMKVIYTPEETKVYSEKYPAGTTNNETNMSTRFYTSFAKLITVNGKRIIFNGWGNIDDDGDGKADRVWDGNLATADRTYDRNVNIGDAQIYLYDSVTDKIKVISISELLPEDDILVIHKGVYTELVVAYR